MKRYSLELYFYKDNSPYKNEGLDTTPRLDEYKKETILESENTWESYENEVLRRHPDVAYIHIIDIQNLGIIDEYEETEYKNKYLYIDESSIHQKGTFAKDNIFQNNIILSLDGVLVDLKDSAEDYPYGEWNAVAEGIFLVRKKRTLYSYINHSRVPNCKVDFSNYSVVAIRNIEKDEEITIDYRNEFLPLEYVLGYGSTYL